jgi:hypothetical protein
LVLGTDQRENAKVDKAFLLLFVVALAVHQVQHVQGETLDSRVRVLRCG